MTKTRTMTEGNLWSGILFFSVPLILTNILQVLFNMSDVAVVGRFAGELALGSVGSCSIFVSLFVGFMLGLGGGVNAIVARYAGAKDIDRMRRTIHTSLLVSVIYGILVMGIGLLVCRPVLVALGTKSDLIDGAYIYMRVYLLGLPAVALYNYGNGVLSAVGDVRRPLLYLAVSGVVNVALNLLFVIVFSMGVLGVALATVISQVLSAVLVLARLLRCGEAYGLSLRELRFYPRVAKTVLMLAVPAGMQNAIFAVANLFIQSAVNTFDTLMVEGNSAAANADALIYDLMAAFYTACTTFIAQNYGANRPERVLKAYKISVFYSFASAAIGGGLLFFCGRSFLSIFTDSPAVIDAGEKRLVIMALSYCWSAFMDCTIAASRGIGKTVVPTVAVILGSCFFRIAWIYTVFEYFHTIPSLYLLYVCSWTITGIFEVLYFRSAYRKLFGIKKAPA